MKKFVAIFLLLLFMLCGCNQQSNTNNPSSENQQINTSSKNEQQNSVTYPNAETCFYTAHSSLPKYEIKVEYTQGKKADYLSLYKENNDNEIQRINLSENERFTKKQFILLI